MQHRTSAVVCAVRPHGETGAVARFLTPRDGIVAAYVAGARGRQLRPILIPGNGVELELYARNDAALPSARVELVESRGPWLTEPLAASAIGWVTVLTAVVLPERQGFPRLFEAINGLLPAICHAPSARGWLPALVAYEELMLRELGFGVGDGYRQHQGWEDALASFDEIGKRLENYVLAERRDDVMAARIMLRAKLARIEG